MADELADLLLATLRGALRARQELVLFDPTPEEREAVVRALRSLAREGWRIRACDAGGVLRLRVVRRPYSYSTMGCAG